MSCYDGYEECRRHPQDHGNIKENGHRLFFICFIYVYVNIRMTMMVLQFGASTEEKMLSVTIES